MNINRNEIDLLSEQKAMDEQNNAFWNELCGSGLAKNLGISDFSEESLKKFDDYYFSFYPYLKKYLKRLPTGAILEIGLGYGTISSYLAKRSDSYFAMDIAADPVACVNQRLRYLSKEKTATIGSAHKLLFSDNSLDAIVSIGCFHHTGDAQKCIDEAYRVLKENGVLLFMCYNKKSFRMLKKHPFSVFFNLQERLHLSDNASALYDVNKDNDSAPFTELSSAKHYRKMCSRFSKIQIEQENWEGSRRKKRLNSLAKILGLDLYVTCRK